MIKKLRPKTVSGRRFCAAAGLRLYAGRLSKHPYYISFYPGLSIVRPSRKFFRAGAIKPLRAVHTNFCVTQPGKRIPARHGVCRFLGRRPGKTLAGLFCFWAHRFPNLSPDGGGKQL